MGTHSTVLPATTHQLYISGGVYVTATLSETEKIEMKTAQASAQPAASFRKSELTRKEPSNDSERLIGIETMKIPHTIRATPTYPNKGSFSVKTSALQNAAKIGAEPREIG
jgi:hypothetical protein